jgi:hypothetical protein
MYYKITNKECEVYQKLHAMRTEERGMQAYNERAIKDKIGLDFESFFGVFGQQTVGRVTQYSGFKFTEPKKVDLKIWQRHNDNPEVFIPNRKTKLGRDMAEFLANGLKSSFFYKPLDILGFEYPHRFTFPFVDVVGEVIVLYLDDQMEPADTNVIEITKREFNQLRAIA